MENSAAVSELPPPRGFLWASAARSLAGYGLLHYKTLAEQGLSRGPAVPRALIKPTAPGVDAAEKRGCEGRWGAGCLRGTDSTGGRSRGMRARNHTCPEGKGTKQGPSRFKGIKVIFHKGFYVNHSTGKKS